MIFVCSSAPIAVQGEDEGDDVISVCSNGAMTVQGGDEGCTILSDALHQGPLGVAAPKVPCLTLSHVHRPPFLKSILSRFRSFWRRHHPCLRRNNRPI